jgi:hypothetical protein
MKAQYQKFNSMARNSNSAILSTSHFPNLRKTGEFLASLEGVKSVGYSQKFSQAFSKFSQNFSRDTF